MTQNRRVPPPLGAAAANRLRLLVRLHGEKRARTMLGLSRDTLARGIAGLGVRPGTAIMIEQRIAALDASRAAG